MLRAIARKGLADLRSRPGQTFLVFFVIALAVASLTVALSVRRSASEPFSRLIEQGHGPHAWFYRGTAEQLQLIDELPAVMESTGVITAAGGFTILLDDDKPELFLLGFPDSPGRVGLPVLVDGTWLSAGAEREIVIDKGLAAVHNVKVGQQLLITSSGGAERFKVVGIGVPTHMPPYPNWEAAGYVSQGDLARFAAQGEVRPRLGIRLADRSLASGFLADVEGMFSADDPTRPIGYTWELVRDEVSSNSQFYQMTFLLYGILGALTGALLIANSIAAQIMGQQREIGVLKAVGFRPSQVVITLVASSLVTATVAVAAGLGVGLALVPLPLRQISAALGTATPPVADPVTLAALALLVLGSVSLFVGVAAWRAARVSTVRAIHTGAARTSGKPSRAGALVSPTWVHPLLALGVRDALNRPARSLLLTLSIALAVVATVVTLGFDRVFTQPDAWPRAGLPHFDLLVGHVSGDSEAAERLVAASPAVDRYYGWTPACAGLPGRTACEFGVRVLSGDFSGDSYHFYEGGMVSMAGDVAVSWGFAREHGVEPGEPLTLIMDGTPVVLTVTGIYAEAYDGGDTVMAPIASLPAPVVASLPSTRWAVSLKNGASVGDTADDLRRESGDALIVDETRDAMALVSNEFRPIALSLNAGLVGIALVNLVSTLLVGVRQRHRDMAIFKAIGLTPGQVGGVVLISVSTLAVAGLAIGLPLGIYASQVMLAWVAVAANIGPEIAVYPAPVVLAALVPAVLAIAVLATWLPARRAAGVAVAETLRYE